MREIITNEFLRDSSSKDYEKILLRYGIDNDTKKLFAHLRRMLKSQGYHRKSRKKLKKKQNQNQNQLPIVPKIPNNLTSFLSENTKNTNLPPEFILNDLDKFCNKIETEADKHSFKTKKNISEMENIHRTMTHEQCRHEEDQAFFTSELNNLENELVSDKKAKEQQIKDFKEILNNLMTTGNTENLNSTPILRCLNNK
jgi:hypothetical protein